MNNFKDDIMSEVRNELDTAIVFIDDNITNPCYDDEPDINDVPEEMIGKFYKLKDIIHLFDYEYDTGFGLRDCQDIIIWTDTKIIYVYEYDGSTSLQTIYRFPNGEISEYIKKY